MVHAIYRRHVTLRYELDAVAMGHVLDAAGEVVGELFQFDPQGEAGELPLEG